MMSPNPCFQPLPTASDVERPVMAAVMVLETQETISITTLMRRI
jgi:hypothetical protein